MKYIHNFESSHVIHIPRNSIFFKVTPVLNLKTYLEDINKSSGNICFASENSANTDKKEQNTVCHFHIVSIFQNLSLSYIPDLSHKMESTN